MKQTWISFTTFKPITEHLLFLSINLYLTYTDFTASIFVFYYATYFPLNQDTLYTFQIFQLFFILHTNYIATQNISSLLKQMEQTENTFWHGFSSAPLLCPIRSYSTIPFLFTFYWLFYNLITIHCRYYTYSLRLATLALVYMYSNYYSL